MLLDPTFNPVIDARVMAVAASPDGSRIYIGGNFLNVSWFPRDYMAEINPDTGAVQGPRGLRPVPGRSCWTCR